jgi:Tfp pilus assembly protein PilX
MKEIIKKLNIKNKGFALVFVMMIVSTISIISAGLLSAGLKQMQLSSLAKDSETAFYQADTASECAFYAEFVASVDTPGIFQSGTNTWTCGGQNLDVTATNGGGFDAKFHDDTQNTPCFSMVVKKQPGSADKTTTTIIDAYGYNMCNKSNSRTVERKIETTYTL